jgi:hypothetical protein
MANVDILRAEITDDPLSRGYETLSDSEVADVLNAPDRSGRKPVPATDVRLYVLLNGLFPGIQNLAANGQDPAQKGTAVTILQTIAPNSFDTIRMNLPNVHAAVGQMLQTMVDAGVMTAQHRTDMLALGDSTISRAQELGLPTVHHLDVAEARNGII